ncbi:guanylate-binding protein 3-like [Discoglossus pictus]
MAPEIVMQHPVCLIENQDENVIVVNQDAIQILNNITQPVVVVAIVGKYRTGKSYLMNKLAGRNDGFALGCTIQSKTKGIWMWCVPHPLKPGHTLVLLDTEGLGDVEKGDSKNDAWIFSLAVLLSSTLVYNSVGTIDQESVEKLHYVTELTERIKLKSSTLKAEDEDESAEFKRTFPSFIWCIRDFNLKLEQEGRPISDDEYLQNSLKLKQGHNRKVIEYNFPRECINHFFHSHKCFVFERPASSSNLQRLEELSEDQLESKFVQQALIFCDYVYQKSQPKSLAGGYIVTGRMLGNLTVTYVESIRSGSVPCMENAIMALSLIENTAAIHEAMSTYEAEMNQLAKRFPTSTPEEFWDMHSECEKKAVKVFMSRSFKDDKREYQVQLMGDLQQKCEKFSRDNDEASMKKCKALIEELSAQLEKDISNGFFCKTGGHKLFVATKQNVIDAYNNTPRKGIKAQEVLQEFLEVKQTMETAILKMDESLTEREKEMEENRIKRETAEQKWQLEKQNNERIEKMREEQDRSFEQQALLLKENLELERFKILKENEWMIEQKRKEKEVMQSEGFHQKAEMLEEQVQDLEKQNEQASSNTWIIDGISILADAASLLLPGIYGKAATVVSGLLRRHF